MGIVVTKDKLSICFRGSSTAFRFHQGAKTRLIHLYFPLFFRAISSVWPVMTQEISQHKSAPVTNPLTDLNPKLKEWLRPGAANAERKGRLKAAVPCEENWPLGCRTMRYTYETLAPRHWLDP